MSVTDLFNAVTIPPLTNPSVTPSTIDSVFSRPLKESLASERSESLVSTPNKARGFPIKGSLLKPC